MSNLSNAEMLIYWINERYNIYLKKERGDPAPWSDNPVMQETYFCNVHRENDRVTKWIRANFPLNHPHPEFNMLVARLVNKPSSLKAMGFPFADWGSKNRCAFLDVMSCPGTWGSAYIVSTNGRAMPKHEYIFELLQELFEPIKLISQLSTLKGAHQRLMRFRGLGSFMAAQIVADLKNTPNHNLVTAHDWSTWCAHGPGSLRGMAWATEKDKITPTEFQHCIPWLREYVDEELDYSFIPKFCNQDLQNCLCEFDKFMRVTNGTGRSKRRYKNGT